MYKVYPKKIEFINGQIFPGNCSCCQSYYSPAGKNPIANGYPSLFVGERDTPGEQAVRICGIYNR